MNYNSFSFWLLFLAVMLPYWRLPHRRQNQLLLVASYVFYGFWDYRFLFLVLVSTYIDFIGGLGVAGVTLPPRRRWGLFAIVAAAAVVLCGPFNLVHVGRDLLSGDVRAVLSAIPTAPGAYALPLGIVAALLAYQCLLPWLYGLPDRQRRIAFLTISMVANLGLLGFFKYCDFFLGEFRALLAAVGLPHWDTAALGILLPAGISFYTFQAMSYTIDIYRGDVEPTESFSDFALFVCFFPHLVAGPIMRAHTLLPQVVRPRRLAENAFEAGLYLVAIGLFKKIVVADNMAPIANYVFGRIAAGDSAALSAGEVLAGLYAFAFQIYGDFSGYSAVARGISKWLGFELAVNFHLPYLATNPSEFWQRWHISLSSWLRDYLYIPLGGNRGTTWQTYRNLMATMLLGGLWHGAATTFVVWGLYHGILLCLFRAFAGGRRGSRQSDISRGTATSPVIGMAWRLVAIGVMFHLTCLGWLFFRADTLDAAWAMVAALVRHPLATASCLPPLAMIAFYCLPMSMLEILTDGEEDLPRLLSSNSACRGAAYAYLLLSMLLFHSRQAFDFIYFQF
ncbi:MAG: MBOAT family protein [Planctomycetia bacterium]|nr:MBOAT family protein [Planctomycetia bacterium]